MSDSGPSVSAPQDGLGLLGSLSTLQRIAVCLLALLLGALVASALSGLWGTVQDSLRGGASGGSRGGGFPFGGRGGRLRSFAGDLGDSAWVGEGVDTLPRWVERERVLREETLFLERRLAYVRGELEYAEAAVASRRSAAAAAAHAAHAAAEAAAAGRGMFGGGAGGG